MKKILCLFLTGLLWMPTVFALPFSVGLVEGSDASSSLSENLLEQIVLTPAADTSIVVNTPDAYLGDKTQLQAGTGRTALLRFDSNIAEQYLDEMNPVNCTRESYPGLGRYTLKTTDPRIESAPLQIPAKKAATVEVRMKNNTSATRASLYYRRAEDSAYASSRRIEQAITAGDDSYKTYFFPLTNVPLITQESILTNLRLDFVENPAAEDVGKKVEVEYIRIHKTKPVQPDLQNRRYRAELILAPVEPEASKRPDYMLAGLAQDKKNVWNDSVTYNQAQALGLTAGSTVLSHEENAVRVDVTAYVDAQKDGVYAFAISGNGSEGGYLYSSKDPQGRAPKLVLTPYEMTELLSPAEVIESVKIRKNEETAGEQIIILALYDENDRLKNVWTKPLDLTGLKVGETATVSGLGFQLPEKLDNSMAKIYLWSGMDTLTPLSDVRAIRQNSDLQYDAAEGEMGNIVMDEQISNLLSGLNTAAPGMEEVHTALQAGNQAKAAKLLVEHFRTRETPRYFYNDANKEKQVNAAKQDPEYVKSVIAEADRVMGDRPDMWGAKVDFDDPNVWDFQKYGASTTYGSMMNRLEWLIPVGQAYWFTGDEKYPEFFLKVIRSWMVYNPLRVEEPLVRGQGVGGLPWNNTIDIGWRLTSLNQAFQYFRGYEGFDEQTYLHFLHLIMQHGKLLYKQEGSLFGGNWQTQECEGLAQTGIMFPEFSGAENWYNISMDRFLEHATAPMTQEDGTYLEPTPGYFSAVRQSIFSVVQLSKLNGIDVDTRLDTSLEKMFAWFMQMTLQDGQMPVPGDTGLFDTRRALAMGAALFRRGDFKYVSQCATLPTEYIWFVSGELFDQFNQLTAVKPEPEYTKLADCQYVVFRDDWAKLGSGNSLFFDVNPVVKGHNHFDYLNFECVFGGERLLTEAGHLGYSHPFRDSYVLGLPGHNVLMVDDGKQQEVWLEKNPPEISAFESTPQYDYAEGRAVYPAANGKPSFEWRRRVVYLKPDVYVISDLVKGEGERTIRRYFHAKPPVAFEALSGGLGARINGQKSSAYVIPAPESGLTVTRDDGFESFNGKLNAWIYQNSATLPYEGAVVVADGGKDIPEVLTETAGVYRIRYGTNEWRIEFTDNSSNSTCTVEQVK